MAINSLKVTLTLRPRLADEILDRRAHGESVDAITRWLCQKTRVDIGRRSVDTWLKENYHPTTEVES